MKTFKRTCLIKRRSRNRIIFKLYYTSEKCTGVDSLFAAYLRKIPICLVKFYFRCKKKFFSIIHTRILHSGIGVTRLAAGLEQMERRPAAKFMARLVDQTHGDTSPTSDHNLRVYPNETIGIYCM